MTGTYVLNDKILKTDTNRAANADKISNNLMFWIMALNTLIN